MTHADLPSDFDSSKRMSALTIEPLTEVETISMTSETRDVIGSLQPASRENPRPTLLESKSNVTIGRAARTGSLGSIEYMGVGGRQSNEAIGTKRKIGNTIQKINVKNGRISTSNSKS
ncbi:hypothetical protein ElyMa_002657100 [Elysia marginata]|uniref:Uncharacterized protein n=1 Tax=Elysia marginata TaxID=1093978 RepID=A0AAV4H942_9GAST|nr:hypothetical protein ElyMa_002657100 [Elysia marginata]